MNHAVHDLHLGSKPAPGELALLQGFVNTRDLEAGSDELADPASLGRWLLGHGLSDVNTVISETDHRQVVAVREAFRALLLAHNGAPCDAKALATLRHVASQSPLVVEVASDGSGTLQPAGTGTSAALGKFFAIAYTAMCEGTWQRLKACQNDACQWAFFDHSKNRSGSWCTMAVCGSRFKSRAYRRRQTQTATS